MNNTNYLFLGRATGVIWKYALSNLFATATIDNANYNFAAVNANSSGSCRPPPRPLHPEPRARHPPTRSAVTKNADLFIINDLF